MSVSPGEFTARTSPAKPWKSTSGDVGHLVGLSLVDREHADSGDRLDESLVLEDLDGAADRHVGHAVALRELGCFTGWQDKIRLRNPVGSQAR